MGMWAELWEVSLSQRCWKCRKDWLLQAAVQAADTTCSKGKLLTVVRVPTTSELNNEPWRRATYRAWAVGFPCRQHVL